ncbi:MAG: insulinase family protein [Eubacterium sp.]|nr:insulinase family protein [Eubacterium sp.]
MKELQNYEIIKQERIEEIDSLGTLLKHKKTGARILCFENTDDNKVFSVGFRTPVTDDTGVPHIIEHTVLCGSEKYPIKDPFMELAKGSLNTFLNAMTYPDKTIYPVASTNAQDFNNLMSVYMDAVFKPNIYKEENIFKQEGWHYELESTEDELKINGIVYSEMKGVYSSADGVLDRITLTSLFPDNGYSSESGGDPESIPDLTYENYLDFHKRYYHPSNCYIYLYGDVDVEERLEWIDEEYLSKYDALEIDSSIPLQKSFDQMNDFEYEYSIGDEEDENENYIYAKNFVVGESDDVKLNIAIHTIEYALMEMPGAKLKEALNKAGIGKDISSAYEGDLRQPVYSIVAKYAKKEDKEKFLKVIDDTLKEVVEEGLEKDVLKAYLFKREFEDKEQDYGPYPKGLMFDLNLMNTWLYDENNPFATLKTDDIYKELNKEVETDYFENIIREYLIDNKHSSVVTMVPKKGLTAKKENKLKEKLAKKKESMSDDEINAIIEQTKALKAYQAEPSTKEQLETIPILEIEDIDPEPRKDVAQILKEDGITFLHSDLLTNGIGYLIMVCRSDDIPKRYLPYIALFRTIIGALDTEEHTYKELNAEIDRNLGEFFLMASSTENEKTGEIKFSGEVHAKMFYDKLEKPFEYAKEIIQSTKFDDFDRIKVLLEEAKAATFQNILASGHVAAADRASSYYNKSDYIKDQAMGIGFYDFVCDVLESYDEKKQEVAKNLKDALEYFFVKGDVIINYGGDKDSFEKIKSLSKDFVKELYDKQENDEPWEYKPEQKNEAFITPGQVQYVARVGRFSDDYNGHFITLSNIMRTEYLWNNIRVLGGAYGCMNKVTTQGDVTFTSYRDPNLKSTSDTYLNAANYIEEFNADERTLRKFIIGAISGVDRPLTNSDAVTRELVIYLTGNDYKFRQKNRTELLNTTLDDLRKLGSAYREAMDKGNICVVGSKSAIEENKDMFKTIRNL